MTTDTIRVTPYSAALGAVISGVDLSAPLSDAGFAVIRQAFHDHGVIFFRDQSLSPEQLQLKQTVLGVLDAVRDESGKDAPVRLVFEPRSSRIAVQELVNVLLAHTSLESNVPVNLVMIGADISERLDVIPAQYQVLVTKRPKLACRACEGVVVQAPAPERLIPGGLPTEATVAHVLVSRYADHLPLYRQSQILARQGIEIGRDTLASWLGMAANELKPVVARLREILLAQRTEGEAMLDREGIAIESVEVLHEADLQFQGQSHLLTIPLPGPDVAIDQIQASFEKTYWHRFRVELPEIRAVLVNLHTAVIGKRRTLPLADLGRGEPAPSVAAALRTTRPVWFDGGWHDTPVLRREALPADARFDGPAIVEQLDTTVVVEPGFSARRDKLGNLVLETI